MAGSGSAGGGSTARAPSLALTAAARDARSNALGLQFGANRVSLRSVHQ
jgi:hypothetical protein